MKISEICGYMDNDWKRLVKTSEICGYIDTVQICGYIDTMVGNTGENI